MTLLCTVLVSVLLLALAVDLVAIAQGWWRSRTAYTLLALGHDGDLQSMWADAERNVLATVRAANAADGKHWWSFGGYRDHVTWWFVRRRVECDLRALERRICLGCGGELDYSLDGKMQRFCYECTFWRWQTAAGSVRKRA